jgi:hypothetical protein
VSRFWIARSGLPGWCLLLPSLAGCPASAASAASEEVVIRGEAVCLDAADAPMAKGAACPDQPAGGWALRTGDGTLHALSSDDSRVVMLSDERVRSRELQITAWRDDRGVLAIVHLRTVVDGRLHDPHYYCAVCSIRAHTPGLCWCCRAPFEFREPPLEGEAAIPARSPGETQ